MQVLVLGGYQSDFGFRISGFELSIEYSRYFMPEGGDLDRSQPCA